MTRARPTLAPAAIVVILALSGCGDAEAPAPPTPRWEVDFVDDFDSFDDANWQDQSIWVNDETHNCPAPRTTDAPGSASARSS